MRKAQVKRKTSETDVQVDLVLDGTGGADVSTGIGFLDHMLHHVAKHGLFDLNVQAAGDLEVDHHHTVEDVARCLGDAFREALAKKQGICRYGHVALPMDEALATVSLDFSGRPLLVYHNPLSDRRSEEALDIASIFLQGFSDRAGITLHVHVENAKDPHHAAEAIFKALGRALRQATAVDPRVNDVPSTKGLLE